MRDIFILSACRTPIGTAFKGSLRHTPATALSIPVVTEAVCRSGAPAGDVGDVVLAESLYGGGVLARYTALEAGLRAAPGMAVNRHCAGGLTAVTTAAASIRSGAEDVIVAGGVQSSSTAPALADRLDPDVEWLSESHPPTPDAPAHDMSITVGWNAARRAGISRSDMDEWALRSHQRAIRAIAAGQFTDEIIPIEIVAQDGSPRTFDTDEHPRADTSLARLSGLRVLHPEIEGFSITAGNASGINDGAAAVVLAGSEAAHRIGTRPLAAVRGWAAVGVEPAETGTAAVAAIRKVLERTGLTTDMVDIWEINEAFASVPIAAVRELRLDEARVNPWGSGCSLGHPVAASGARMITTVSHELSRRGCGVAVVAMCAGGGMAAAAVLTAP